MTLKNSLANKRRWADKDYKKRVSEKIKRAKKGTNRGIKNPMFGKKHSKKSKIKMSLSAGTGINNHGWKGGKTIDSLGYIKILSPKHPHKGKDNYVREHRLVMEKYIKRFLLSDEIVHHINEIKDDNRIENLMLFPNHREHILHHRKIKRLSNERKIFKETN